MILRTVPGSHIVLESELRLESILAGLEIKGSGLGSFISKSYFKSTLQLLLPIC